MRKRAVAWKNDGLHARVSQSARDAYVDGGGPHGGARGPAASDVRVDAPDAVLGVAAVQLDVEFGRVGQRSVVEQVKGHVGCDSRGGDDEKVVGAAVARKVRRAEHRGDEPVVLGAREGRVGFVAKVVEVDGGVVGHVEERGRVGVARAPLGAQQPRVVQGGDVEVIDLGLHKALARLGDAAVDASGGAEVLGGADKDPIVLDEPGGLAARGFATCIERGVGAQPDASAVLKPIVHVHEGLALSRRLAYVDSRRGREWRARVQERRQGPPREREAEKREQGHVQQRQPPQRRHARALFWPHVCNA